MRVYYEIETLKENLTQNFFNNICTKRPFCSYRKKRLLSKINTYLQGYIFQSNEI